MCWLRLPLIKSIIQRETYHSVCAKLKAFDDARGVAWSEYACIGDNQRIALRGTEEMTKRMG